MHEFAGEQYLSRTAGATAERGATAARLAAEQLTREGTPVHFVCLIFIPADETCLYIYEAASAEIVQVAAARAALRFERVSYIAVALPRPEYPEAITAPDLL